jgi:uncharacterized OsmC-like protein
MAASDIAAAISGAREYLTANPDEARYRDGAATASVEDGLRVRVTGTDGSTLVSDMVTGIGGGGSAPSPGWLLRAAYASCVATLIAMRASEDGFSVEGLEVVVDSESDDRGVLGISADVPAGPLSMRVVVTVAGGGSDKATIRAAIQEAVANCPVHDAVVRAVPVEVDIQVT